MLIVDLYLEVLSVRVNMASLELETFLVKVISILKYVIMGVLLFLSEV